MPFDPAALFFLLVSWFFILGLMTYCFVKLFGAREKKSE